MPKRIQYKRGQRKPEACKIVTRISRTDYAVTYKIRDGRSGALVAVEQTDLRAGANSAWSRGARWLIQRRLLEQAN